MFHVTFGLTISAATVDFTISSLNGSASVGEAGSGKPLAPQWTTGNITQNATIHINVQGGFYNIDLDVVTAGSVDFSATGPYSVFSPEPCTLNGPRSVRYTMFIS